MAEEQGEGGEGVKAESQGRVLIAGSGKVVRIVDVSTEKGESVSVLTPRGERGWINGRCRRSASSVLKRLVDRHVLRAGRCSTDC